MSISDEIVVMKDGVVQQIGRPQEVYDSPVNLFVAKFLGTPPIHVFRGEVKNGQLLLGGAAVLAVPGAPEGPVTAAVRPEGFVLDGQGPLACALNGVEVMGRDISVVCRRRVQRLRVVVQGAGGVGPPLRKIAIAVGVEPQPECEGEMGCQRLGIVCPG